MINVGINGFGRVGKTLFRIIAENPDEKINIIGIKDYNNTEVSDNEFVMNMAYLLQSDSIYGKFPREIDVDGTNMIIGTKKIPFFLKKEISSVDWNKLECDILIEASGTIDNLQEVSQCLGSFVKKIIITRGYHNVDLTLVFGVNDNDYNAKKHNIISTSTCTGNAFIPIANIIHNNFDINNGILSTIHPVLSYEKMMDGFNRSFPLGRSTKSIKLTPTSIVKSTVSVLPHLEGKLMEESLSYRVPTDIVSAIYGVILLGKSTNTKEILDVLDNEISKNHLDGIIKICHGQFGHSKVSIDYLKDSHSSIIDSKWVSVKDNLLRLHIWHDNEYGYCRRVFDTIRLIAR